LPITSDTQEAEILRVVTRGLTVRDPSAPARKSHRGKTDTDHAPSLSRDEALVEENDALKQELQEEKEEYAEIQALYDQALPDLRNRQQEYRELGERYERQIAQRQSDSQKVQNASEYCGAADRECDDLKTKLETFEEKYELYAQQHDAELQAKNEEFAKLEAEHQCAIEALNQAYQQE
jgi:chromosome segregation ATPase